MTTLTPLEELLIKQTVRFVVHKLETTPYPTIEESSFTVYSENFLKALYDNPRIFINDVVNESLSAADKNDEVKNKKIVNEKARKDALIEFFSRVADMRSEPAKLWTDLHHYLCFVYRLYITVYPDPIQEKLPQYFIDSMRKIISRLYEEDQVQLCLRILSVAREYTRFAHKQHSQITNIETAFEKLFLYYEAFVSATKNVAILFPEIEKMFAGTYTCGWMDICTSIFVLYFFESPHVQKLMDCFPDIKEKVSMKAKGSYTFLNELKQVWSNRVKGINTSIAKRLGGSIVGLSNTVMADYESMISNNYWLDRERKNKLKDDLSIFDCQLFTLVSNKSIPHAEPLIDDKGQCLCEDCLLVQYKSSYPGQLGPSLVSDRIIVSCKYCKIPILIGIFKDHVKENQCKKLCQIINDTVNTVKLNLMSQNSSIRSRPMKAGEIKKELSPKIADGPPLKFKNDQLPKIAEEAKTMRNGFAACENDKRLANERKKARRKARRQNLLDGRTNGIDKENMNSDNCEKTLKIANEVQSAKHEPCTHEIPAKLLANGKQNGMVFPCGHACRLEDELKAYHDTCEHKKVSNCDCAFCEVFSAKKSNETRNRLRYRLTEKVKNKAKQTSSTDLNIKRDTSDTNLSDNLKLKQGIQEVKQINDINNKKEKKVVDDIDGLISFIEGNTNADKIGIADKKAAKKARQRNKKEQERLQQEEEERKRLEEEKRQTEERLRNEELARQLLEKATKKENKKKKQKNKANEAKAESIEETVPAMVTIKRVIENDNSLPTVTITLKGSTPDQDKLLYTLVNGGKDSNKESTDKQKNGKKKKNQETNNVNSSSKNSNNNNNNNNKKNKNSQQSNTLITKELRVTLAVDSVNSTAATNPTTNNSNNNNTNSKKNKQKDKVNKQKENESQKENNNKKKDEVNIPMFKLPPGITITKVERPIQNKTFKISKMEASPYEPIPVTKSGVIVIDTERLIKQSNENEQPPTGGTTNSTKKVEVVSKKSKKKRNKKQQAQNQAEKVGSNQAPKSESAQTATNNTTNGKSSMVTLKNPIFRNMPPFKQDNNDNSNLDQSNGQCQQAAIFKNENGMVTIRSSRLQQSLSNGGPMPNVLSDLRPVLGPEVPTTYMSSCNFNDSSKISPFNAQEILSGLPGIEITKVDKNATKNDFDKPKLSQTAEVSIIPTNHTDKFNFDKDDLHFDSVFSPKEIEDDMDADERELEAFKRFCQQSVPPKRKEKVAHLNVKDIVLKKKNDNKISA